MMKSKEQKKLANICSLDLTELDPNYTIKEDLSSVASNSSYHDCSEDQALNSA